MLGPSFSIAISSSEMLGPYGLLFQCRRSVFHASLLMPANMRIYCRTLAIVIHNCRFPLHKFTLKMEAKDCQIEVCNYTCQHYQTNIQNVKKQHQRTESKQRMQWIAKAYRCVQNWGIPYEYETTSLSRSLSLLRSPASDFTSPNVGQLWQFGDFRVKFDAGQEVP